MSTSISDVCTMLLYFYTGGYGVDQPVCGFYCAIILKERNATYYTVLCVYIGNIYRT